jgi:hypothetical protein
MAQLFTNDLSFTKDYPMKLKSETLVTFIHEVGIPSAILSDDAPEIINGKYRSICKGYGIYSTFTEP